MSGHAWVSDVVNDVDLALGFAADIVREGGSVSADHLAALRSGKPVPRDGCPTEVWAEKEYAQVKDGGTLPPVLRGNGYVIVGSQAAAILRRHDLGGGALYPVRVLQSDRATPFAGGWFTWVFGNTKDTLDIEASVNLRPFSPIPGDTWRKLGWKPADGDVALSAQALEGPDVWMETCLHGPVCLSGPLGDELKKAKLAKAFRLIKARVV